MSVVERSLPGVPRGWVLVKVLAGVWSGVEEAVAMNYLWVEPGRVLGMFGYGVVVDVGVGAPRWLSGRRVVFGRLPLPYGVPGVGLASVVGEAGPPPGLGFDGWLAEYAALPASGLSVLEEGVDSVLGGLSGLAGVAWVAGKLLASSGGERVGVVGGGFTGLLAAFAAGLFGRSGVPVYSLDPEAWRGVAGRLGVEVRRIGDLRGFVGGGRGFDALFLSTLEPYSAWLAASVVGEEGVLVLHPTYSYARPPPLRWGRVVLLKSFPGEAGLVLLRRLGGELLEELVGVVEGLGEPPVPRPKPVLVYRVGG